MANTKALCCCKNSIGLLIVYIRCVGNVVKFLQKYIASLVMSIAKGRNYFSPNAISMVSPMLAGDCTT